MTLLVVQNAAPRITVRVPGCWRKIEELADRLPDGFHLEKQQLIMPDGRRLWFEPMPADSAFPTIFRTACRRPPDPSERNRLDDYTMNAALATAGGSFAAAQGVLEAAASLVHAGGMGVFIDNSASAHGGGDWLELAENRHDSNALFYTFINMAKSGKDVVSYGMHVFGQRDAVIGYRAKQAEAVSTLEDFLRIRCASSHDSVADGEEFCDKEGRRFRLTVEPDRNPFGSNHPIANRYGRWRLKRV